MRTRMSRRRAWTAAVLAGMGLGGTGCHTTQPMILPPAEGTVPSELHKVTLPPYVIEPPDVLLIEIRTEGKEAGEAAIALTPQPIEGQHLVGPDGAVNLGVWGSVPLAGLTVYQARELLRSYISQAAGIAPEKLLPVVSVISYNSKFCYIVTDGATDGEQVYPIPVVGSETVLDTLGKINGLPVVASRRNIWVARRAAAAGHGGTDHILPVDWIGITQHADHRTNYQILPGDRIYVKAQKLYTVDAVLRKIYSPIERTFGVILLGSTTVNSLKGQQGGGNNNGF
jgi:polysaccharide export outer membrane protein